MAVGTLARSGGRSETSIRYHGLGSQCRYYITGLVSISLITILLCCVLVAYYRRVRNTGHSAEARGPLVELTPAHNVWYHWHGGIQAALTACSRPEVKSPPVERRVDLRRLYSGSWPREASERRIKENTLGADEGETAALR